MSGDYNWPRLAVDRRPADTGLGGPVMTDESEGDDLDIVRAVAEVRARSLTHRLRLIGLSCMAVIAMLITASFLIHDSLPAPYTPLRVAGFIFVGAFVALTYRPEFAKRQELWGWLLVTSVAALAAYGGTLRQNPAISAILETMLALLTSAILPWGVGMQIASVASCALLLGAAAWILGPYPSTNPDLPVLVDATAAFLLSLFVSQRTRTEFDAATAENLRLEAARERIRSLADQLEEEVRRRTAELEATLADQQAMTRSISHDLRQPLRHIGGFTQMLRDDLADSLDADHRDQMTRVCRATARMDRMVDALLEISRVAGKPLEQDPIDVTRMATELGETLARAEPDRSVELTVEPGLTAVGDSALVRTLLHQLMANAWKFTRGREPAGVHVGRRAGAFFVRDSGSGFDMKHATKMFETFERLHHPSEFEGEGVGLAIARRVVRRHGGRIWAESRPGEGATFFFTLSPGDA